MKKFLFIAIAVMMAMSCEKEPDAVPDVRPVSIAGTKWECLEHPEYIVCTLEFDTDGVATLINADETGGIAGYYRYAVSDNGKAISLTAVSGYMFTASGTIEDISDSGYSLNDARAECDLSAGRLVLYMLPEDSGESRFGEYRLMEEDGQVSNAAKSGIVEDFTDSLSVMMEHSGVIERR